MIHGKKTGLNLSRTQDGRFLRHSLPEFDDLHRLATSPFDNNFIANHLQGLGRILEICDIIPDLRTSPHPDLPIMRIMRDIGVEPV